MDFNKQCYDFQKEIVDIFNRKEIPFLLKYYLFKEIWENVEQKKFIIDGEVRSSELKEETISGSLELTPEDIQDI